MQAHKVTYGITLRLTLPLLCALVISLGLLTGCGETVANPQVKDAGVVTIDGMKDNWYSERLPVQFPHDLHTSTLKASGKDCQTCHMKKADGKLSPRFMRLTDSDKESVMNIYHDSCITCHNRTADEGLKAGPVTCGECHRETPTRVSSRKPFGFDKSLHGRHINKYSECITCHHNLDFNAAQHDIDYNPVNLACADCHANDDLVTYEMQYRHEGAGSCRDCHREKTEGTRSSLKHAAHEQCITCHLNTESSGPVDCAGCHDEARQQAITSIDNPPRLKANQPDFVLLSAPENELDDSKMATVPFSHVGHEGFNETCRVCHHESLNACSDCHTLGGENDGGRVKLQQAMHDLNSGHSCVGCHEVKKSDTDCAGCHDLMEQGRLSEHACTICHSGPHPERLQSMRNRYHSLDQFRPKHSETKMTFSKNDIPEMVTIGKLSDKYMPAEFPHRRIVEALGNKISENKIAAYFHGHEDLVCQGCHHHSPVGEKPPLCENCHSEPFNEADLFKPGLFGAYHRQCLGCHQSMSIEEPSDCVGCHAERKP